MNNITRSFLSSINKVSFPLALAAAVIGLGGFGSAEAAPKYSAWSAPVPLTEINSAFTEFGSAISKNELSLYFSSGRPGGEGSFDIWVSQRATKSSAWGAPVNLGSVVNSSAVEILPNFSRDGHMMFFSSNRTGGFAGPGFFDNYVSERSHTHDDFDWGVPVNLGPGVNAANQDNLAPHFYQNDDEDGTTLLYISRGLLTATNTIDIYVSTLVDGTFGTAVPVPELNSPQLDARFNQVNNGLEVFFYSARDGGSGVQDLWTATRDSVDDPWSEPVNLGPVVNSSAADQHPAISSDGLTLYFASNRGGSFDLYKTTRTKLNE